MDETLRWEASIGAFVNVLEFSPQSWTDQLAELRRLDHRGHVEVWLEWMPRTPEHNRLLRDCFAGEVTTVHAPFLDLSLVSRLDEFRHLSIQRVSDVCGLAAELGSRVVTLHAGSYPFFDSRQAALDRLADSYRRIKAPHPSMSIALENMSGRGGATREIFAHLEESVEILDRIPDIEFTLDIGHAIQNGDDYAGFLAQYGGSVANIHLHDGVHLGSSHLRLGAGELDVAKFVTACVTSGYNGFISLETIGAECTRESWRTLLATLENSNVDLPWADQPWVP